MTVSIYCYYVITLYSILFLFLLALSCYCPLGSMLVLEVLLFQFLDFFSAIKGINIEEFNTLNEQFLVLLGTIPHLVKMDFLLKPPFLANTSTGECSFHKDSQTLVHCLLDRHSVTQLVPPSSYDGLRSVIQTGSIPSDNEEYLLRSAPIIYKFLVAYENLPGFFTLVGPFVESLIELSEKALFPDSTDGNNEISDGSQDSCFSAVESFKKYGFYIEPKYSSYACNCCNISVINFLCNFLAMHMAKYIGVCGCMKLTWRTRNALERVRVRMDAVPNIQAGKFPDKKIL
jgi:hypothetical protein